MIIYSTTKCQFKEDVVFNRISDLIQKNLKDHGISGGTPSEYNSWQNSLQFMYNVIDDTEIPDDVMIAIEYQIPGTSKRVDFMIIGADQSGRTNIIIVELKQWGQAEKASDEMPHCVRTYTGGAYRTVSHPSYQAYSYSLLIKNSSDQVQDEDIFIIPCAYLHNYDPKYINALNDEIYKTWYEEAPFFIKTQVLELRNFVKKYISQKAGTDNLLDKIDQGRHHPSKALQDCLVSLMNGHQEFVLLDDQIVIFDLCKSIMKKCQKDGKKRTIIIRGGPGTGKSVLAINLLKDFITKDLNASYCTKNSAPREVYLELLSKSDLKSKVKIKQLFRSPFGLCKQPPNYYDCLIVDESHRLVKKMYRDYNGTNQVKECIAASLFTIFLLDEDQRITTKDIGSVEEIQHWAKELGSDVIVNEETTLVSQFRCNGSKQYIQFVDNILQKGAPVDIDVSTMDFDVQVFDNPNVMRDKLRKLNEVNNKARMLAGYCYDWNVKYNREEYDILLEDGFAAKWNLDGDKIWGINPKSFEQIGCIHTSQGIEFDYVGVLIGKDLRYDPATGTIITDKSMISTDDKSSGIRTASDSEAAQLIKNTYRTLLTRGQKGCYIYCEDKALSEYIKRLASGNTAC